MLRDTHFAAADGAEGAGARERLAVRREIVLGGHVGSARDIVTTSATIRRRTALAYDRPRRLRVRVRVVAGMVGVMAGVVLAADGGDEHDDGHEDGRDVEVAEVHGCFELGW